MLLKKINFIKFTLKELFFRFSKLYIFFKVKDKKKKLQNIDNKLLNPEIFRNYDNIKYLINNKKKLEKDINKLLNIKVKLVYVKELFSLSLLESNFIILDTLKTELIFLKNIILSLEFKQMFNNPYDKKDCFLDIKSGAGGVESQDWAFMLLRQYLRFCERKKFKVKIINKTFGEITGIKTATIKVKGKYAYGFLRTESGIHRLVRKSPFNSSGNRHTSFASLYVYPNLKNLINININISDVRIDTYKSSGPGGQHVNKTDSAVRILHKPTGIIVQCQNNKSQYRNKAMAWNILKNKLFNFELNKQLIKRKKIENSKSDVSWGQQIRSYILDQSRIKDLRTNYETNDVKAILDGDIENFIFESLKLKV